MYRTKDAERDKEEGRCGKWGERAETKNISRSKDARFLLIPGFSRAQLPTERRGIDGIASISEKCRWIHLYSARRISRDYLSAHCGIRQAWLPLCREDLSRLSSVDLFLQMPGDERDFCIFQNLNLPSLYLEGRMLDFVSSDLGVALQT